MNGRRTAGTSRILIVNPFGIGDVLFSTPLIRAIRSAFPNGFIVYLCNRRTERILQGNPHLNQIIVYEKDEWVAFWKRSWWQAAARFMALLRDVHRLHLDLAIDLSLGERYSFLLACLGVPRRIGFNYRRRGRFLTDAVVIDGYHQEHVVEYYRQLLRFYGIELQEASLELRISNDEKQWAGTWLAQHALDQGRRVVGMVPAGGVSWGIAAPFRRWSFEGFAAVADALIERCGVHVILFGESSDAQACQTVAKLMHHSVIDLSGQTTLGQFVSLLSRLELVICNDGGPLHLAVSQRVKTVSIFGPVDPRVYGPYAPGRAYHRTVYHAGLRCRPCYHQFKLPPCPYERACLTMIEPEVVLQACVELVEASHDWVGTAGAC